MPVSVREFLTLLESLKAGVINPSINEFYQLSRMTLVKDEQHFDQIFGSYFRSIEQIIALSPDIPVDWLEKKLQRVLTDEEKAALQKLGVPRPFKSGLRNCSKNKKNGMVAAINGLALAAPHHLVIAAITQRGFELVAIVPAIAPRSKFGRLESLRTMTAI